MFERFLILMVLVIAARVAWTTGQRTDLQRFIDYMQEDPEIYRLWDHILLLFHKHPFSIITLSTLSFVSCIALTYILITPSGIAGLIFILGVLACSSNFSTRHSIQYPLLALLVLTNNPVFLVPLILTKELAAWLGLGHLVIAGGLQLMTMVCALVAFLLYVAVRKYIGRRSRHPKGAPLFTPPFYVNLMLGRIEGTSRGLVVWNMAGVVAMLVFLVMNGPLLLLWTAGPILLFALWWEPQLWLPVVVVVLAGGAGGV